MPSSKLYALFDRVTWSTGTVRRGDFQYFELKRGEEVPGDIPEMHRKRLEKLGAIGPKDAADQAAAAATGPPRVGPGGEIGGPPAPTTPGRQSTATTTLPADMSDEELAKLNADQVTAFLNQHNDQVDRVDRVEEDRPGDRRKTVDDVITRLREAQPPPTA